MATVFQFPYIGKNFMGLHASASAATAWILANRWDTHFDGTGAPQKSVWFYNTDTNSYLYWNGSAWMNIGASIPGGVYVDAVNGSDGGDGTIVSPFKTLAGACASLEVPTDVATWATPVAIHLAPGAYEGAELPQRMHISIDGDGCAIKGDLGWGLDPQWWHDFGVSNKNEASLVIARRTSAYAGAERGDGWSGYEGGFWLRSGTLGAYNSNAMGAYNLPGTHSLVISGVIRDAYNIYNIASKTGGSVDATGDMHLYLRDSADVYADEEGETPSYIGGEADQCGGESMIVENAIYVVAERSSVRMRGVCRVSLLDACEFSADRTMDILGVATDYGMIGGDGEIPLAGHVRNSTPLEDSTWGCDPTATAPAFTGAASVVFDRASLLGAAVAQDMATAFPSGFLATQVGAFGRGWWWTGDDLGESAAVVRVPQVPSSAADSGKLFRCVYEAAGAWLPGGSALATDNRLAVEVEGGKYLLSSAAFSFSHEFVDVIGQGRAGVWRGVSSAENAAPGTAIESSGGSMAWAVEDASLQSFLLTYSSGYALTFTAEAAASCFLDVWFDGQYAALIDVDPGDSVHGTWEDCHALVDRMLYGGTFTPVRMSRCSGKNLCFGASGSAGVIGKFSGTAEDSVGENYAFGANSASATDAECSGTLHRCEAGTYSFGGRGKLSGVIVDCEADAGSFGVATEYTYARLERCAVRAVTAAAGAPGFWGAIVRSCEFYALDAEDVAAVNIVGGVYPYVTTLMNCDLYSGVGFVLRASSAVAVRMAHCRMNAEASENVSNLIEDPCNVVDQTFYPFEVSVPLA
jgi:hypothetical protein